MRSISPFSRLRRPRNTQSTCCGPTPRAFRSSAFSPGSPCSPCLSACGSCPLASFCSSSRYSAWGCAPTGGQSSARSHPPIVPPPAAPPSGQRAHLPRIAQPAWKRKSGKNLSSYLHFILLAARRGPQEPLGLPQGMPIGSQGSSPSHPGRPCVWFPAPPSFTLFF